LLVLLALFGASTAATADGQLLKKMRDDVRGENPPDPPSSDPPAVDPKKAEEDARREESERRERIRRRQRRLTEEQCRPDVQAEVFWGSNAQNDRNKNDRNKPVRLPPTAQEAPLTPVNPYPSVADDFQPVAVDPLLDPLHGHVWLRTTFDVAFYEDNIDQYGSRFLIGHHGRVYIDSEVNWLVEDFGDASDGSAIGDVNAILVDLRSPWSELRAGLGANWLHDVSTDFGFNVTSDLELYLTPWKAMLGVDWGTLGDADFLHARAAGGVEFDRIELFAGYDFRAIGDVQFGGPVVGLTMAF
jgi:hypothetical protein